MAEVKENKMGVMPMTRLIITMSLPMMLSMLVQALYNIVDSMWVAKVSQDALTAVSLAFPIQNLMIAFATGTAVGVNALVSRALGAKDNKKANDVSAHGLVLSLITSVFFMIFGFTGVKLFFSSQIGNSTDTLSYGVDYLSIVTIFSFGLFGQIISERLMQSTGKTTLSMISQLVGAIINIILDPILILGWGPFPRLEAKGAAIATVVGQIIAFILGIFLNKYFNKEITLTLKGFKFNKEIIKEIYVIGVPSIIMVAIGSVMTYFLNKILISFTETAATVFGVYFKLQSFFFMPVFGMNNGVIPIIAYNYGAKNKERMVSAVKRAIIMAVTVMVAGTIVMCTIPDKLLLIFKANEQMLSIGIPALRIISASFPIAAVCIASGSVYQALGKSFYSMIISFARQIIVLLPVARLLANTGNINNVWYAFPISEIGSLIITVITLCIIYKTVIKKL